jgi:RNA polymerase sigma-70 factor, ECF subfamily
VTLNAAQKLPEPTPAEQFNAVVAETTPKLFRLAARLVGSQADAEDVLQESYVRAFDAWRLGRFEGRAALDTWLYRIVVRTAVSHLRTRKRGDARDQAYGVPGSDALSRIEASAELRELAQWLDLLPEEQRSALVLKELEGLSTAEVAEVLECSVGAVEQRLHRARASLKKRCDRE